MQSSLGKHLYKDPHISEGAGRAFIPVERKAPKQVCASPDESTNVLIRSTAYGFREQKQYNFHNCFQFFFFFLQVLLKRGEGFPEGYVTERHKNNLIKTTKYTMWNFLPKNLFEQFHRFANLYFLFIIVLNFIPQVRLYFC